MPLELVENVAQVVSHFNLGVSGEKAHMVWHYYSGTGWSQGDLQSLGDNVNDAVVAELMPNLASAASYEGCTVLDLGVDGAQTVDRFITPVAGSIVADMNPVQVALVISWRSTNASRNGRGRSYVPGIPRNQLASNSHVTAGYANAINAFADELRATVPALGSNMVIVSRIRNKVKRIPPVTYAMQSNSVGTRLDTQRRRLPRI